jgi:hypothetical protein
LLAQVPYHFERHGPRYAALEFWFSSNCLLILNTVALGFSVRMSGFHHGNSWRANV